ncbi:MAG: hypothetical protein C0399_12100 [Syntrophus sp. (in: bacteria)]|nr:hypothetical protein [Syntrophus sp. (in: bacteria)]
MCRGKGMLIVVMVVFSFFVTSTMLYGFDEKQVQTLKKTNNCKKCDLSGATLSNLYLEYADLSGANLSGADLSNAMLANSNLSNANLSNSNLSNSNLSNANLSGANVSKANLSKIFLDQATWTNGKGCKVGSIGACKQ